MIAMALNDNINFYQIFIVSLCNSTPFLACWIVITPMTIIYMHNILECLWLKVTSHKSWNNSRR
jgi:hypothetical protein